MRELQKSSIDYTLAPPLFRGDTLKQNVFAQWHEALQSRLLQVGLIGRHTSLHSNRDGIDEMRWHFTI